MHSVLFLPTYAWSQCEPAKLTSRDETAADGFGLGVAAHGDTVVVGAGRDDERGENAGAAYVFRREARAWTEVAKLTASDATSDDRFGYAVAVLGDFVVVGAYGVDNYSGAAYVFLHTNGTWEEVARLQAADARQSSRFGTSVALSGKHIAVGASGDDEMGEDAGAVYVFRREEGSWAQVGKLLPSSLASGDRFGAVSISEDVLLAGASGHDREGIDSGAAWIYRCYGDTWVEEAKLVPSDAVGSDFFGRSVSVSGGYAAVGAPRTSHAMISSGAAYVFRRNGAEWSQMAKLTPADGWLIDWFGVSVALTGTNLVVGAHQHDGTAIDSGAAYLFKRQADYWAEASKLMPAAEEKDRLGYSVGISGTYIVVGSLPGSSERHGAAYVYTLPSADLDCNDNGVSDECEPDCNANGTPDDCDLVDGSSRDDNGNGVPDECEKTLRVDSSAKGTNNGCSWKDAFTNLQDALVAASPGDEIWVAAGSYSPAAPGGDRNVAFDIGDKVAVYGGFGGWEHLRDQRDSVVNVTILNGDLNRDDDADAKVGGSTCCDSDWGSDCDEPVCKEAVCAITPDCCKFWWSQECADLALEVCCELCFNPTTCDNSYHVVTATNTSESTVLDGFLIMGGHAIAFLEDRTTDSGGGMYLDRSRAQIANCRFERNTARQGGAMYSFRSEPSINACTFGANQATEYGGAMMIQYGNPSITECIFGGNSAQQGGAVFNERSGPTLTACTFTGNISSSSGGAVSNHAGTGDAIANPTLIECIFIDNSAEFTGGGMSNNAGTGYAVASSTLANCAFIGNAAKRGGGGMSNSAGTGDAVARSTLTNCTFIENAAEVGGGMYNTRSTGRAVTTAVLRNCVFSGNRADEHGGGVYNRASYAAFTNVDFVNCTLTQNVAQMAGGGVYNRYADVDITNSILWANRGGNVSDERGQLYSDENTVLRFNYNFIQGWTGAFGGIGNIGDDPLFEDPVGLDGIPGTEDDNLRLTPESPCINTGDPATSLVADETDFEGNPRVQGCRVDMGAYESNVAQAREDFGADGQVDMADFAALQLCYGTAYAVPSWSRACLCVFDVDHNETIDADDFRAFLWAMGGP